MAAPLPIPGNRALAEFVSALETEADFCDALVHREHLPARRARCAELPAEYEHLAPVLTRRGITAPYIHQVRALAALGRGHDVVLATPTASGKTLVYALSTLRAALADPRARALYLFPLKALSQDQRRGLEADIAALGRVDLRAVVYDGDTPAARRRSLRDDPPQVLITTPDMLHAGILPHHGLWKQFFAHLSLVVVDELHTYRGVFALCDRHDVAGITYTRHPQLGRPAIFFYDSHAGGVGITASLFDRVESLLETTLELIADCACEAGCPGCVHSPKCSNGNRPIDKAGAIQALALLLGHEPLPVLPALPDLADPPAPPRATASVPPARAPRLVYFDLETQRSAEDVGGWQNAHRMRVAVAVIYDSAAGRYETFDEAQVPELLARLAAADLVVGFNVWRFDYAVLRGYAGADPAALPTFDLLHDLHRRIGFRLPLGHLAEETLGIAKSGDGLQSLAWWRAGEVARVADYCRRDVEILRALFEHALAHGHLRFRTRDGRLVRLPARWNVAELIEAARGGVRYAEPRPRRRLRSSSSKSIRAFAGSAAAIVTTTRSPSS